MKWSVTVPTLTQAQQMLQDAADLNPGPWVDHSLYVAAARTLAEHHPDLDPEQAYIYGSVHDIRRRAGVHDLRHILDGYHDLTGQGFEQAARICMTHSFPLQDVDAEAGVWNCTADEKALVVSCLGPVTFNEYDRLLQLCDALALPSGFCLLEKRFVDVVRRPGFNARTLQKWEAWLTLGRSFSQVVGGSVYAHLPGVVQTTFGVALRQ